MRIAIVLISACAFPAFAHASAQDVYVNAVIGGASVAGLIFMVAAYRLARAALRRVNQAIGDRSERMQRKPVAETRSSAESARAKVIEPSETLWSAALSEFDGANRRLGLWAKVFAEAAGDEGLAKSEYLRVRAHELHSSQEVERQNRMREIEKDRAATHYAQLANGNLSSHQIIQICEAQLRALGFDVERPRADKWEIRRNSGSSFAYTVEDLRRLADAHSAEDQRGRAVGFAGDAA